ncbi:hypothetical protein [Paenibacillus segetis]|uniref:Restriction endonuclease BglII n=1 Tax=Paenibacillus segetis TaxID=1325360 RepID=A0ABQ1YIX5_9BACL|nr:hypothetical protein [Paenibacillus segetis]GGH27705.1 hypothetical protein GCM10008013_29290 [Paenibacillus segetis]
MRVIKQSTNSKGSFKQIQNLVNNFPSIINLKINEKTNCSEEIIWLSPLKSDKYAEYRDKNFLGIIGHGNLCGELNNFWPSNGPQWDGLAKSVSKVFLVEAKANLPELISSPSRAKSMKSIELINASIEKTKSFISDVEINADWTKRYYQYTNRLAHLYFLREQGIDAYLINLYFIGDKEVNGPETEAEWVIAKNEMESVLHLPSNHRLRKYILDIYIHVNEMK